MILLFWIIIGELTLGAYIFLVVRGLMMITDNYNVIVFGGSLLILSTIALGVGIMIAIEVTVNKHRSKIRLRNAKRINWLVQLGLYETIKFMPNRNIKENIHWFAYY